MVSHGANGVTHRIPPAVVAVLLAVGVLGLVSCSSVPLHAGSGGGCSVSSHTSSREQLATFLKDVGLARRHSTTADVPRPLECAYQLLCSDAQAPGSKEDFDASVGTSFSHVLGADSWIFVDANGYFDDSQTTSTVRLAALHREGNAWRVCAFSSEEPD
jgi:hypothetical protein